MQKLNYYATLLAFIFLIGVIGGCGQKGDLYLPDNTVSKLERFVN